jgi:capsular exopolysaccharide synthesis family protein
VVSAVVKTFIQESEGYREKVVKEMYETLNKQLMEKHKDLKNAERELTKFILEHDIIARGIEVGKQLNEGNKEGVQGSQINEKYLALKSRRINDNAFLEEIKRHRQEDELTALSIIAKREESLVDLNLRDELYEKERELAKLLLTQSELHPDAIEAQGEVEEAKKKIGVELDRAILSLERTVQALKREEEKLRGLIKEGLSEKMVEYSALVRDVEVKKDIYNNVIRQLEELDIYEKLLKTPFIKVVKAATMPVNPINKRSKSMFVACFISVFVGVGSVFMVESLDISLKDIEDVEDAIGLTLLAAIPTWEKKLDSEKGTKVGERKYDVGVGLVTRRHPQTIMSEAFRTLRTNIRFVGVDKSLKSFIITSVSPKEGKSVTAANLAVTMARAGENVILIDGDLRRPTLHHYFPNIDNSKGLSSLLVGEASIEEIMSQNSEIDNLKVIAAGPIPPNPNEILGTKRMEDIIARLNQQSDMVIIDSSPILTVSDSLILAAKTDGAILVFLANKTAKKAAFRANMLLKNAGVSVLGAVLNGMKITKGGYYYNYDYYGEDKKT